MSKLLVTLVHLSFNDPPLPVSLADFLNSQPSITVLVPTTADSTESRLVNPSLSLVHTVLGLLSKRDLINEQSSKYLVQYFQFFNMYTSIGMAQCHHLINADIPFTLMQFALDELPTTVSNVNIFASHSHLSASSSFSLNYAKPSAATATTSTNNNTSNANTPSSSQYADLTKLFAVVSTLIRCFDLSPYTSSSVQSQSAMPNPFSHHNELKLINQQLEEDTTAGIILWIFNIKRFRVVIIWK
jgi:hypothetical protein